jgi:hypothetical protein
MLPMILPKQRGHCSEKLGGSSDQQTSPLCDRPGKMFGVVGRHRGKKYWNIWRMPNQVAVCTNESLVRAGNHLGIGQLDQAMKFSISSSASGLREQDQRVCVENNHYDKI